MQRGCSGLGSEDIHSLGQLWEQSLALEANLPSLDVISLKASMIFALAIVFQPREFYQILFPLSTLRLQLPARVLETRCLPVNERAQFL